VPFTSVYAGKYGGQKTNQKQTLLKLNTTQKKQTTQSTVKQNYPGSVAFHDTQPGNEVGLFYNAPKPTWGTIFRNTLQRFSSSDSLPACTQIHTTVLEIVNKIQFESETFLGQLDKVESFVFFGLRDVSRDVWVLRHTHQTTSLLQST